MFNPNKHPAQCETYLSRSLRRPVDFLGASQLTQSTRTAPWRLDVNVDGVARSFVLQLDAGDIEYEYRILKAMEPVAIPTPDAYGLDLQGEALGVACFFSDFIQGESLLGPMLAGEPWAEKLYLDAVCALQAVTEDDLGEIAGELNRETAADVLENAYASFDGQPLPLAEAVYCALKASMPAPPALRFSNGDLWLDNFIVRDRKLAGVIDFQNAAFSDPIFEFLLSFFVSPELQGRGVEERYCLRLGYDPAILHWYHGLELLDTWAYVLSSGESFVHHTAQSLEADLRKWLQSCRG